jgi:tetratricopeptide (TPR) repeat protein
VRAGSSYLVLVVLAIGSPARAQPSVASATAQFDRGRALMKDKKYAEACAAFELSHKLDPQNGTLYNLADCYTHTGKLASAWAAYRDLAQRDANMPRKKQSAKLAATLEPRLPKLVIQAPAAAGLVVQLDGVDVTALAGSATPVDLGAHAVHATAPKSKPFDMTTTITDEGKTTTVAIELLPAGEAPPTVMPPISAPWPAERRAAEPAKVQVTPTEPPRSHRKLYGALVAAGGVATITTGFVFGKLASNKWSQAKQLCGDDLTCDNDADLTRSNQLAGDARRDGNLATALVAAGAVAVGVGVVIYLGAPSAERPKTALRISATPDAVNVVLGGRF